MRIGSDAHRDAFCSQFNDSYTDYVPDRLPWPALDEASLARLRAVPFWQEVLHTERRAGAIVDAFAATLDDPVVKAAVLLQGQEETRHAELLRVMIRRYGIDAVEQPLEPLGADLETAFIDFGYGECVDSFLGFGVFKIARQSGFLPEPMFEIFDTLMYEETRHIVFFINWMAWREVRRGRGAAWQRALTSLRFYLRAARRLAGTVRAGQQANEGRDFSATQAGVFLDGFTFRRFLADCHGENRRRMAALEGDLLQPRLLPALAGVALSALRVWNLRRRQERPA
ncbi:MAG TPA: ferritin-like domain-containing protein [Stellaceae bacterium]|nr:ferritin-like domain-containing protein [Stellaceae bacterium]